MNVTDMFEWLESSSLAGYIRHSHLLYPVIEIIHIIGFVFLVGSAFLFDFRLLGVSKKIPVTDLAKHLLPWSRRSLLLVIPSGFLLFMTQATSLGYNKVFWTKLILILLAFLNAGFFFIASTSVPRRGGITCSLLRFGQKQPSSFRSFSGPR